MAKKSLAEKIAGLFAPKTDFDIEDSEQKDVFDGEQEEDFEDDEEDEEDVKNDHYITSEKSKLRDDDFGLGEKYEGNVVSRDQLEESDEQEEEGDEDEEPEDESEEEGELVQEEDSEVDLDDEDLDEDSEEDVDENSSDQDDSHENDKRQLVKKLMSQERTNLLSRLSQSVTTDAIKGYAISTQHQTFDKIIDSRLKFQKSITTANLLPATDIDQYTSSTKLIHQTKDELYNLLDSIILLRNKLESTSTNLPKKRTYSAYCQTATNSDKSLTQVRSSVLTKWSAKVQNSSGTSAINANKFKTINQSFETQVENNLSDMSRLIKRTKLNRRQIKPMGLDQVETELDTLFDDEDFYRVLLNDLVDKKVQSSGAIAISLRTAQRANKLKNNNIDTKASKGRKLRYHVQEEISNFETSIGNWKWNDDKIDEFFASLLGQKVNMNEQEEEKEEDEEEELIPETGITLFG
ncbi:Protein BFR2 [Spathaspora sp. JA1]|nr:Protein BFR2 [Spathaspora sp. JA1]